MQRDPRCENAEDEEIIRAVAADGWYVLIILEKDDTPGWAFSVGLYENFKHPEVVIFGLAPEVLQDVVNSVAEDVRSGKSFEIDGMYPDLIDTYACTFKPVNKVWYDDFLGYANWFYQSHDYPALQCIWPDKNNIFPWDPEFNPHWLWGQPLLFHEDAESARTVALLASMKEQ